MLAALENSISQVVSFVEVGGYVMPALAAASLLLWFGIGYRISALRRPGKRQVGTLIEDYAGGHGRARPRGLVERAVADGVGIWRNRPRHLRRRLDAAFADAEMDLKKYSRQIKALVIAAPLMGLLGTVNGMVETFDALADQRMISQSGSIAAGISKALFATQLGLAVAIPGLFVNGALERRARETHRELEQIKNILCARAAPAKEHA
ncbi:MAG: MotA/TolQ/ExbB proton channel family protein [Gammaproteobacteria bacterium]|nr:MotA/TolQ/ExbB proton channel family protein [Gammaproteobacteria bacterium]